MKIKLEFFGQLVEITGSSKLEMDEVSDTDSLMKKIENDFPKLKNHKILIAVNKKIIKENQKLETGSEVALLPPFAGG